MYTAMLAENKSNDVSRRVSGEPDAKEGAMGTIRSWMHRLSSTSSEGVSTVLDSK